MPSEWPMRRRGRPSRDTSNGLSNEILSVANEFFLRDGFQATSMDAIAAELGCSKRTLYTRFAFKAELFEAVIRHHQDRNTEILTSEDVAAVPFDAFLRRCGQRFLEASLTPSRIALFRLVIFERRRYPELLTALVSRPLASAAETMRPVMAKAIAEGILPPGDPAELAEQFLVSVCGREVVRAVVGLEGGGLTEDRLRRIETVVALFARPPQRFGGFADHRHVTGAGVG